MNNNPALARALNDLRNCNSRIFLENRNIRVVYRCRLSALAVVRSAIAVLRQHKLEAIALLTEKSRGDAEVTETLASRESGDHGLPQNLAAPPMPPHVRLVNWNPKEAPIAIDSCTVVVDVALFIKTTLDQLAAAVTDDKRWVGWSVPQLADRLRQAGVVIELS